MQLRENIIVPLGYGKYVRSDKIVALEPIEDDRGPGRRTFVYLEELKEPLVASRTETAIVANIAEVPQEVVEATCAMELLQDILDDLRPIGPMLRKSIKKEAGLDIDKMEKRIEEILSHEIAAETKQ